MSKQEAKKEGRIKTVKKSWFKIMAPQLFGAGELGETYLSNPESALGRTLRHNLKELTGNVKDQNAYLLFKIDKAAGTMLHTIPLGYELTVSSVKRMVKKNTTRVDDYFTDVSKDGKKVAVKSVLITSIKIQRSVGKVLRKMLYEAVHEDLSKNNYADFMVNLASGKIRNELRKRLAKIYPLKEAAIRSVTIIGTGAAPVVPSTETAAVPEQEGQSLTKDKSPLGDARNSEKISEHPSVQKGKLPLLETEMRATETAMPDVIEGALEETLPTAAS